MLRLAIAFWAIISASQVMAAITAENLRDMAYANDVDAAEQAMKQAHHESLSGDITFDHLRDIVGGLLTTHPDAIQFTANWIEAYPNSPYGKAIRVFQMNNTAFTLRGTKFARQTHPEALEAFYGIRESAQALAEEAYEAAPDFVPASDAKLVMQLAQRTLTDREYFNLLTDIMDVTPNVGSLGRALNMAMPQWGGGGLPVVRYFCSEFANKVTDVENYSEDVCVAHMIGWVGLHDDLSRALAWSVLNDTKHPRLHYVRLTRALHLELEEEREFLLDWFRRSDTLDYAKAIDFVHKYPHDTQSKAIFAEMDVRLQDHARAQLPHDPYNPNLLTILQRRYFPFAAATYDYNDEDHESYALRRTVSEPFDPYVWQRLAQFHDHSDDQTKGLSLKPYYSNAIYYSMHSDELLSGHFNGLMMIYDRHKHRVSKNVSPDKMMSSAQFEEHVLCPFIRVTRVRKAACTWRTDNEAMCADKVNVAKSRKIVTEVEERGICRVERFADIETLYYMPVEMDVERVTEDIANR